jgi:integrase
MASNPYPDKRRGVWRLKYRPDPIGPWVAVNLGKDPRLKGPRPPKTPPQFVIDRAAEFREIEYRARHGLQAAPARAKTLATYLQDYAERYDVSNRTGSVKQLRRHVRTFLAFAAARGVASLQGVTKALCRDYLEERARAVAPSTLKTERGYLVGIWSRAVDDGLLAANPWRGVKVPGKIEETAITFWTAGEIGRIAAAAGKPWQRDFILLLANTGLRISSALALEWSWIDDAAGTLTVRAGEGVKTAYTHALSAAAKEVLARRRADAGRSGLVFPNPHRGGGKVPYDSAREAIARAIDRAKVRAGTPHDLRHSYARLLVLSGVPITVVQSQLGHTTLAMTMRYTKVGHGAAAGFVGEIRIGVEGADSP